MTPGERALVVPFPELAGVVEPWLEHSVGARPSHGFPPHVTLLFPCPDAAEEIAGLLGGLQAFDVEFRETRRFPDVVYLAPEPAAPFVAITDTLLARFPDWPPYAGAFSEVVPHLTVAWGARLDEAEAAVAPALPLRGRAREAVLFRETAPQRWQPQARFPFPED
jgi:2'-5' RNA ligase superfamily